MLVMEQPAGLKRASGFGRGPLRWRRLGEILTSQRVITRGQLLTALDHQADLHGSGRTYPLGRVLVSLGYASMTEIDGALAQQARQAAAARARRAPADPGQVGLDPRPGERPEGGPAAERDWQ